MLCMDCWRSLQHQSRHELLAGLQTTLLEACKLHWCKDALPDGELLSWRRMHHTTQAVTDGLLWAMDRATFRTIVLASRVQKRARFEKASA